MALSRFADGVPVPSLTLAHISRHHVLSSAASEGAQTAAESTTTAGELVISGLYTLPGHYRHERRTREDKGLMLRWKRDRLRGQVGRSVANDDPTCDIFDMSSFCHVCQQRCPMQPRTVLVLVGYGEEWVMWMLSRTQQYPEYSIDLLEEKHGKLFWLSGDESSFDRRSGSSDGPRHSRRGAPSMVGRTTVGGVRLSYLLWDVHACCRAHAMKLSFL